MMREKLKPRRAGLTLEMIFKRHDGSEIKFFVTFGFDEYRRVKECFCLPAKSGTDLQSLIHHACIGISVGLQHGATMAEYARALGEDDPVIAPQSIIGLIVRAGVKLDAEQPRAVG